MADRAERFLPRFAGNIAKIRTTGQSRKCQFPTERKRFDSTAPAALTCRFPGSTTTAGVFRGGRSRPARATSSAPSQPTRGSSSTTIATIAATQRACTEKNSNIRESPERGASLTINDDNNTRLRRSGRTNTTRNVAWCAWGTPCLAADSRDRWSGTRRAGPCP